MDITFHSTSDHFTHAHQLLVADCVLLTNFRHINSMSGIQIDGWVQLPGGADEETIKRALVNNGLLAVSFLVTDQVGFIAHGVLL